MPNKKAVSVLSVLAITFILTIAWTQWSSARAVPLGDSVAGAWLGTFISPAGMEVPIAMVLNDDGTWHSSDITDFGLGTGREIQSIIQGSWSQSDTRKITALGFGFSFDSTDHGEYNGTLGLLATVDFNDSFDELSAELKLGIWNGSLGDLPDPLGGDPPDTVLPSFRLTAKRIPTMVSSPAGSSSGSR